MALQFVLNNLTTKIILLCFLTQILLQLIKENEDKYKFVQTY